MATTTTSLEIYADEIDGISIQGDQIRVDLKDVDVSNLIGELVFELGALNVLSEFDPTDIANFIAEAV